MAAQRFARSAAAKTVMFNPESGSELSERGKELQAEMKQALLAQQKEDEDRLVEVKAGRAAAEYAKLKKKAVVEAGRMGKVSAVDLAAALDKLSLNADGKVRAKCRLCTERPAAAGAPRRATRRARLRGVPEGDRAPSCGCRGANPRVPHAHATSACRGATRRGKARGQLAPWRAAPGSPSAGGHAVAGACWGGEYASPSRERPHHPARALRSHAQALARECGVQVVQRQHSAQPPEEP